MKAYVLLVLLIGVVVAVQAWGNKDKVRLDQVSAITLKKGAYTTGRRSSPVPQLNCVGGAARHKSYEIDTVQCRNVGSDGNDAQWRCESDMDSTVRFGQVEVSCEGYDYPDDPFILKGSCGLEYTLEFTNQGKQQQSQHNNNYHTNSHHSSYNYNHSGGIGFSFKSLLMLGIVVFIFYNIYKQCTQMTTRSQPGYGGPGTGGFPGNGGFPPGGYPPGYGGGNGPYDGSSCAPPPPPQAGWRPGFWTGLATGGFMGNLFNRPRYGSYYGSTYHQPTYSSGSFSSGPSFSSGGSSSRTSSGFGGTRRR